MHQSVGPAQTDANIKIRFTCSKVPVVNLRKRNSAVNVNDTDTYKMTQSTLRRVQEQNEINETGWWDASTQIDNKTNVNSSRKFAES